MELLDQSKYLNIDNEIERFDELEIEVDKTLKILDTVIDMFTTKAEMAKGSSGKLVLLIEQKVALLTRKESIIKNIGDMKNKMHTANAKINNAEDENTDFAKVLMRYTEEIKKKRKKLEEEQEATNILLDEVKNKKEVDDFFDSTESAKVS